MREDNNGINSLQYAADQGHLKSRIGRLERDLNSVTKIIKLLKQSRIFSSLLDSAIEEKNTNDVCTVAEIIRIIKDLEQEPTP